MGRIGPGATARCLVATSSGLWVGEVITRCASLKAEKPQHRLAQPISEFHGTARAIPGIHNPRFRTASRQLAGGDPKAGRIDHRPQGTAPRGIITTSSTRYSAADAIAFAKEAIDGPAMQGKTLAQDQARRIARNMASSTALLKRER